ncbi:ribose-phosphate diphosphokinase [Candidatus Woesearchaeota archaeon]|nr:ribose-phosphate diphosphokinase [Candidatus Woesearchaeota archaeon]
MKIIACSNGKHLAKSIAKKLKKPYSELETKHFPDNELKVAIKTDVKKKRVVLVQSFHGSINDQLVEVLFAAYTAKDLGAKSIMLVAPYFPYLRQDKAFNKGESVSIEIVGKLIDRVFDEIAIIDPHLHREKGLNHIFKIRAHRLTANPLIADYIKKHVKNAVIIGPDWESYKWAEKTADIIGCESAIMEKKRYSARKVSVKLNKKIDLGKRNVVIVDDIISTGHTLLESAKLLRKIGAKKITAICVHAVFVEKAYEKLKKAKVDVISANTILHKSNKIDVVPLIVNVLG